jgi:hypothetical protein
MSATSARRKRNSLALAFASENAVACLAAIVGFGKEPRRAEDQAGQAGAPVQQFAELSRQPPW